ncbi:MAG: choice-of-anchor L domain-containing protein [Bacteroidia bacterium]|nr:choice-of-anchor L domain-containing protein [Bacteroidia bacterium]
MKKRLLLSLSLLCLFSFQNFGQSKSGFTTTATGKESGVRQLLESLVGEGIVLKNYSITRVSSSDAFAKFEDPNATLGMKKGLLMTSGCARFLPAANTLTAFSCNHSSGIHNSSQEVIAANTYPELSRILKGQPPTYDACVIELDVVPTSDTLSFNYVFGSEEYDKYVGSEFNDAFAFFISGKGIDGERNLAVLPGTNVPVSVNTINNGNSEAPDYKSSNPTYYVSNKNGELAMEYNGFTRLMEIRQPVIAYETYHIKMAIADVFDDALDSGVFIEGQSFISYNKSYNVLFESNSSTLDDGYKTMLQDLVKLYKNKSGNDKGILLITGHTDADGSQQYNDLLSQQRVKEVVWYLKSLGMDENSFMLQFKGENMPRADNFAELGKHLNRRVEIKFCGSTKNYQSTKLSEYSNGGTSSSITDNFPNPFNTTTNIRAYIQPEVKNAYINVVNMKGTLIKTIQLLERGNTESYFDAVDLAAGVYVATLFTDNTNSGSIKLLVQK